MTGIALFAAWLSARREFPMSADLVLLFVLPVVAALREIRRGGMGLIGGTVGGFVTWVGYLFLSFLYAWLFRIPSWDVVIALSLVMLPIYAVIGIVVGFLEGVAVHHAAAFHASRRAKRSEPANHSRTLEQAD